MVNQAATEVDASKDSNLQEEAARRGTGAAPSTRAALNPDFMNTRRLSNTSSTLSIRRPSIRKSGVERRTIRFLRRYHDWKTEHMYLGRYSIEKMLAFEEYQQVAGFKRVLAVIVLTPLPSLLLMILLAAVPLQDPLKGVNRNPGYFIQAWLAYAVMTFSMMLFVRASLILPNSIYSHKQCVLISLLTTGSNELMMFTVSSLWRFPIPFRSLLGIPTYTLNIVIFHRLVLGTKLTHYREQILEYLPLFAAQASILFIFEGVTLLFAHVPAHGQAVITILFPVLRSVVKRIIWKFARCLEDISIDVTLCVVELFGSLFQNACLQSARSPAVGALMIMVDFVQAVVEVRMYMHHKFVVDGRRTTQTAVRIIENSLYPGALNSGKARGLAKLDPKQTVLGVSRKGGSISLNPSDLVEPKKLAINNSRRQSTIACLSGSENMLELNTIDADMTKSVRDKSPQTEPISLPPPNLPNKTTIDDVDIAHRQHAKLLSQALQLVFASEVLVFAEYAEFISSVLYGLYSFTLYHMPYAKYNLTFIGLSESNFWITMTNCCIYAASEGVTMFFLFMVVRAKYGLSTFYQLAFVLEKYWASVQGKLVGSLALIFILNTVHQGTDLSLEFDWEKVLNGTAGS